MRGAARAATTPGARRRRAELAAIHAGRRALGLEEAEYRALLEGATGKASAADLTGPERTRVLELMRAAGYGRTGRAAAWRARGGGAARTQAELARALWAALCEAGAVRASRGEAALSAFVERQTGKSRLEWCTPEELNKVIEGLKAWQRRAGKTART